MNGQKFFIGCLVGMAILAGALAESPLAAAEKENISYIGPASAFKDKQSIAEKLATDVEFRFVETPLKDVVSVLQDVIGTTVFLNAKKLEEAAVSVDTPITMEIDGVQLRTALKLLLDDLELSYVEHKQYLLITTPEDAESQLLTRVYDTRELLASQDPTLKSEVSQAAAASPPSLGGEQPPSSGRSTASAMGIGMAIGSGMGLGIGGAGGVVGGEVLSDADRLIDLVTSTLTPQSWDDVGGYGSIVEYKGLLVISHTSAVHDEIEQLLNMLHEASGLPTKTVRVIR